MSKHVLLLGATGTIGRATASALVQDGHQVTCLVRQQPKIELPQGCNSVIGDVSDMKLAHGAFDAVISCIASRTGSPKDAWAVDYELQSSALKQAVAAGIPQFILLSAICVQKPLLAFQQAKLAFEAELQSSGLHWSIIRPTAFFKSLSGQVERVRAGKPFLVFGDGELTACKPISDADLGRFLSSALSDPAMANRVLPIGGPGPALTPRQQGLAMFGALGIEPKFHKVPIGLMRGIIAALSVLGKVSSRLAEKAELARIGHYYATESMLVWDAEAGRYDPEATPEFGSDRLAAHFAKAARGEIADDRGDHAVF